MERALVRQAILEKLDSAGAPLETWVEQLTVRELRVPMGLGVRGDTWNLLYEEIQRRSRRVMRAQRESLQRIEEMKYDLRECRERG